MKKILSFLVIAFLLIPSAYANRYTTTVDANGRATTVDNKTNTVVSTNDPELENAVIDIHAQAESIGLTTQNLENFRPFDFVSREEVAVIIKRGFDK